MINIKEGVYFSYATNNTIVEHVGYLYHIIKAGTDINGAGFGVIVAESTSRRTIDMYIVDVKGVLYLTAKIERVPVEKEPLWKQEAPYKKHRFYDIRDRLRIMSMANCLGDNYVVTSDGLYIPNWGTYIFFDYDGCVEYISDVTDADKYGDYVVC